MNITVYVREEHIKNSEKCNSEHCMLAEAMLDAGFYNVGVCDEFVRIDPNDGSGFQYIDLSDEVGQHIRDFDRGNPVQPFKVTFEDIEEKFLVIK